MTVGTALYVVHSSIINILSVGIYLLRNYLFIYVDSALT
jgi:hypothetical protein